MRFGFCAGVAVLRIEDVGFQGLETFHQVRCLADRIDPSGNRTPVDRIAIVLRRLEAGGRVRRVGSGNVFLLGFQTVRVLIEEGICFIIGEPISRQP